MKTEEQLYVLTSGETGFEYLVSHTNSSVYDYVYKVIGFVDFHGKPKNYAAGLGYTFPLTTHHKVRDVTDDDIEKAALNAL